VSLNPATPASALDEILPFIDLVLVMSVNPGFGGQEFIETSVAKIATLRRSIDEGGHAIEIEVDGGISPTTVGRVANAGASVVVAGNAIFAGQRSVAENIRAIRDAAR
jgi:ribulose-phosphate 3-epimerase